MSNDPNVKPSISALAEQLYAKLEAETGEFLARQGRELKTFARERLLDLALLIARDEGKPEE